MWACAACNLPTPPKRCPCHQVHYCSVKCQRAHWSIHKVTCTKLKKNDTVRQVIDEFNAAPPRANIAVPGAPTSGTSTAPLAISADEKGIPKKRKLGITAKNAFLVSLISARFDFDQALEYCSFIDDSHVAPIHETKSTIDIETKHRNLYAQLARIPVFAVRKDADGKLPGDDAVYLYIVSLPFEDLQDKGGFTTEELDAINRSRNILGVPLITWPRCTVFDYMPYYGDHDQLSVHSAASVEIGLAAKVLFEKVYCHYLFKAALTGKYPVSSTWISCVAPHENELLQEARSVPLDSMSPRDWVTGPVHTAPEPYTLPAHMIDRIVRDHTKNEM